MTEEGGKRSGNGMLVGILSFLVLVIVGLVVGIVVVNMREKNEVMPPEEEWATVMSKCMFDFNTEEVDCMSFKNGLEKIINTSDEEDMRVKAGVSLSSIYEKDDINSAIDLLEGLFDDDLSDQNKYCILKTLLSYYGESGDKLKYVEKLQKIIELPDSMSLEFEDWETVKKMFIRELETINNQEGDNEE